MSPERQRPPLFDRLLARVAESGPLPFEAFMRACLYDPDHGFFTGGPLRSAADGDFLTSPEVSPWFGRALGRFAAAERSRIDPGGSRSFVVADVGAGSGSLLAPLATEMGDGPEIWAIDASPAARVALSSHEGWKVAADLGALPEGITGVVFANELLDNFPVALAVRRGDRWEERWVGAAGDGLELVARPARADVAAWADAYGGGVGEGGLVEVQLAAGEWLTAALNRVEAGTVAVIDYGGTMEELEPRRAEGTLRTYRSHHLGPDPLTAPGDTDITVDVNFTALEAAARAAGAVAEIHRQDDFLASWGLRDEVSRLRRAELELARGGDAMERLRARSERTAAETVLHPRGLGDFRVLIARTG